MTWGPWPGHDPSAPTPSLGGAAETWTARNVDLMAVGSTAMIIPAYRKLPPATRPILSAGRFMILPASNGVMVTAATYKIGTNAGHDNVAGPTNATPSVAQWNAGLAAARPNIPGAALGAVAVVPYLPLDLVAAPNPFFEVTIAAVGPAALLVDVFVLIFYLPV